MITIDEALQGVQDEFIDNCILEDIELYYELHEVKGKDLIEHCLIMADELKQSYQNYYQIKL
jgi:hypothetical protein